MPPCTAGPAPQSYGGGRDIWGLSDGRYMKNAGFSPPIFDDGLIEVSLAILLLVFLDKV